MSQPKATGASGEMNVRRAHQLKREIVDSFPQLTVEVWAIAQGLAYLRVEGPLSRGVVTLVLKTEGEVASFLSLAESYDPRQEPRSSADRLRDLGLKPRV